MGYTTTVKAKMHRQTNENGNREEHDAYLSNWKVKHFLKVSWQTSEERIKGPVIAEVCCNDCPHSR